VDADEFEVRLTRLLATLDDAAALLVEHGEQGWAAWLEGDRRRIAQGDLAGLDHLLAAFGGMGSLNDLVFDPRNGNTVAGEHDDRDNEALDGFRASIYTDATAMRRELRRRSHRS
jgi:hypothetical protein